jgi:hypothetical protein
VQEFDRYFAIEFCVLRQIDLTHAARANPGDDSVIDRVEPAGSSLFILVQFFR